MICVVHKHCFALCTLYFVLCARSVVLVRISVCSGLNSALHESKTYIIVNSIFDNGAALSFFSIFFSSSMALALIKTGE